MNGFSRRGERTTRATASSSQRSEQRPSVTVGHRWAGSLSLSCSCRTRSGRGHGWIGAGKDGACRLLARFCYLQTRRRLPSLPCSRLAADSKDAGGSGQQLFLLEKKNASAAKMLVFFFLTKPPSDFPRMADQHDECCMSGLCHMTHYFLHGVFEWETPIVKCHQSNKAGPHSTSLVLLI